MIKGLYLCGADIFDKVYGPQERAEIENRVEITNPPQTAESIRQNLSLLKDVEVLFGSWGFPRMDAEFLSAAPHLKAVFYGAGSVKDFVTESFWERDILLSSAYAANAVPVSEFVLSQILFCLKHGWQSALSIRENKCYQRPAQVPGAFQKTVGLVSLGMIGRLVCEKLRPFDLKVLAYDPFASSADAAALNVELCSLQDLFRRSDVVSLHTPWLPETEGLISGQLIDLMKDGSSLINTARGAIVREHELIEVMLRRPHLFALLDVTWPEPPVPGSPLYTLPNIVLTPHIAGSLGLECRRMGHFMVEELKHYLAAEPLAWRITKEKAALMA